MPPDLRPRYAGHLAEITAKAPHLLITFEYDQTQMSGPPFSVPEQEVRAIYGHAYSVSELETIDFPGLLKGQVEALERAWLITV